MATLERSFYGLVSARSRLLALITTLSLLSVAPLFAIEDPPGCSLPNGGLQLQHVTGLNFNLAQAHIGDAVPVFTILGMPVGACRAINATGSIWIATGKLSDYLVNVTLDPGTVLSCPGGGLCVPGANNLLITPALVGAGVGPQLGFVPGFAKTVRAAAVSFAPVLTGFVKEEFSDLISASLQIVSPCIHVVNQSAYPQGQNCFEAGHYISFAGYVTNCGDIRLTNILVSGRFSSLLLDTNGFPLLQPLSLNVGEAVGFQGSFATTMQEVISGYATNTLTVRGTDTTTIGGPRASVTNVASTMTMVCLPPTYIFGSRLDGTNFGFSFPSIPGFRYVVRSSLSLGPPDWHDVTNFLESNGSLDFFNAVNDTQRFYRVEVQRP